MFTRKAKRTRESGAFLEGKAYEMMLTDELLGNR